MTTPQTPASWYPDPDGSGGQRYWDGWTWTDHRIPPPQAPPPPRPAPVPEPQATTERVGAHRAPDPDDAQPDPVVAATAVFPTIAPIPAPPPGPPTGYPTPPPPTDASRQLLVRYLAVCAALVAVLAGVVVYAVVNMGSGDVSIAAPEITAQPGAEETTEPTAETTPPGETATEMPAADTPPAGTGDPTDGALAFSVYGIETGPSVSMPDLPVEKTAVGEFVVVHLTVTNISDAPATFLGTFQKLKAGGVVYSIDDEATFYVGGGLAELNPGDHMDVAVAFDVPPGTVPEAIELHADPMSAGVEVSLA